MQAGVRRSRCVSPASRRHLLRSRRSAAPRSARAAGCIDRDGLLGGRNGRLDMVDQRVRQVAAGRPAGRDSRARRACPARSPAARRCRARPAAPRSVPAATSSSRSSGASSSSIRNCSASAPMPASAQPVGDLLRSSSSIWPSALAAAIMARTSVSANSASPCGACDGIEGGVGRRRQQFGLPGRRGCRPARCRSGSSGRPCRRGRRWRRGRRASAPSRSPARPVPVPSSTATSAPAASGLSLAICVAWPALSRTVRLRAGNLRAEQIVEQLLGIEHRGLRVRPAVGRRGYRRWREVGSAIATLQ